MSKKKEQTEGGITKKEEETERHEITGGKKYLEYDEEGRRRRN